MKVLILNDYSYIAGGAEVYANNLCNSLKKSGHKVLFVGSDRSINGKEIIADEILPASGHFYNLDSVFNYQAFKALGRIADKFKPDVVHYNNIFYALSPSVLFALKKFPQILSVHDYYLVCNTDKIDAQNSLCTKSFKDCNCGKKGNLPQILARNLAKYLIQNKIKLIAPSKYVEEQFKTNNINNITSLPYPTFAEYSSVAADIEGSNSFTFIGRLAYQKGVDILINAFAKLNNPNIILNIIGSGPEEENLKALAHTLKVESQIIFHGWKNQDDICDFLFKSLAIVIPSRWPEVYGLVLNEAASKGVPAIVSNLGALPELVTHQRNGLVFDLSDSNDLHNKLSYALNNRELMKSYGHLALKQAKDNTPDLYISKLLKIYGV